MVLSRKLQDIVEASTKISRLSLPVLKENKFNIYFTASDIIDVVNVYNLQTPVLPFASSEVFKADIIDWRCLTNQDNVCKAVYEITFDVEKGNFSFKPGDTIGVIPQNEKEDVDMILESLDLSSKADLQYSLEIPTNQKGCKIPPHIPVKSTIRHVLHNCCDLRAVPKKLFLLALSRHTKDEDERKTLEYLCSKEGSVAYNTHILNQHCCLLDILCIFKSCKPPIQVLFSHLPRLLPRPYSIVNSSVKSPNVIKICFSVMDLGNKRKGLVTSWLEKLITEGKFSVEDKMQSLSLNDSLTLKVPIYLRKNMSGFIPTDNLETPLILIAAGTGVAPFIGFLEQRQHLKENCPEVKAGTVWLYFGCRNPKLDFIYEKELKQFLNNETIDKISMSFSRIENAESKYVQDALMHNGKELVELIETGASIYVCGDVNNMAVEVKESILMCLVKHGNKTEEESKTLLSDMQAQKKYLVDVWS